MQRTPVTSTQIISIGYLAETQTLEIEFKNQNPDKIPSKEPSIYQFHNVPSELHAKMMKAESVGKFFGTEIKPHKEKFPFKKIN